MGIVYMITDELNGKGYVGQTQGEIEKSMKEHIYESRRARSQGIKLYDAMREHGVENFSIKVLEEVEDSLLDTKEQEYIKLYNTVNDGYNMSIGGKGSPKIDIEDEELLRLYKESGNNLSQLERDLHWSRKALSMRLNALGIKTNKFDSKFTSKDVLVCKNLRGDEQARFNTCKEAANWVIENKYTDGTDTRNIGSRIKAKAKNKGKIYGFMWEIEENRESDI